MQRYFVLNNVIDEKNKIARISDKENVHHIRDVMRMKPSDMVLLLDNSGYEYLSRIENISNIVDLKIIEKRKNNNELNALVDIYHGLVRREKKEETLRRLVELGCHKYVPVMMERSIVKMDKYKENDDRIKTIIKECSEQAERGKLMKYNNPITFSELINESINYDYKFVCFEDSGRSNDKGLLQYLDKLQNKKVMVVVGPEGGISPNELTKLIDAGFVSIGLGKRILRTETAPLFVMSLLAYHVETGEEDG